MTFDFDEVIDRRGSDCAKWDAMETKFGVSPDDGLAMWVADMDFRVTPAVTDALRAAMDHGVFGYHFDRGGYRNAVVEWMATRHGWEVDPEWMTTTHGLVSAIGLLVQAYSEPGDGIILFTPVYHAFHRMVEANDRQIVQSEMREVDGRYELDLDGLAKSLTGRERMVIFCSPHNPGGRVWTVEELRAVADFCAEHDLILVSDEIHHDLVFPGARHTVMSLAAPEHVDRTIICAAATKTFNLAGALTGGVFIENPELRARFRQVHNASCPTPNSLGLRAVTAAYADGVPWLEALIPYIDGNRRLFDAGIAEIPGLRSMHLESTYLAWVDFSGTGMATEEFTARVERSAKIAVNHGPGFGQGGGSWLRFNLAIRRAVVEEAVGRLRSAFADLQ